MISVIVPSRNEIFLNKTVEDILNKAKGEVEVLAILDGYWPEENKREHWTTPAYIDDERVTYIHFNQPKGMRVGINAGVGRAKGEYIMKADGHCMFEEGFDLKLQADMQDNWVVIPSRYSLEAEKWEQNLRRPRRDYHYLCYPDPNKDHDGGMHGVEWLQRGKERSDPKYDIDNNMCFQGSCWYMKRDWFTEHIGWLDEDPIYGGYAQEPTEIACKTWLGGGKVVCNKKTWYAHLYKGRTYGRGYKMPEKQVIEGHNYAAKYWMNNSWPKQIHTIDWLIDKFWPVPTWPENWREHYKKAIKGKYATSRQIR